jgi:hypothetical protein
MVYDLSCQDVRLTLEFSVRDGDEGPETWQIVAFAREAPEKPTLDELGPTRGDALRAVARAWMAKGGSYGFPVLDWDATAQALLAVRAI